MVSVSDFRLEFCLDSVVNRRQIPPSPLFSSPFPTSVCAAQSAHRLFLLGRSLLRCCGGGASSPLQPTGPQGHIQFSMKNFLWNHTVHIWESYVAFDRQLGLLPLASDTSSRKYSTGNNSGTEWTHQCPFNKIFKKDIQNQALGGFHTWPTLLLSKWFKANTTLLEPLAVFILINKNTRSLFSQ